MDLKNCRVLVTPTSFGKYNPKLRTDLENQVGEVIYNSSGKPLTSGQLSDILPNVDGFIAGLDFIDKDALQAANTLKIIARYGVGVDRIDLKAATEKGIVVSNTPGANASSVAELALCLILMLSRQIPQAQHSLAKGEWPRVLGVTLQDKNIGIIGLGAIGKQLTKRLSSFDCNIIAFDPFPDKDFINRYKINLLELENLLPICDFISLHVPALPETHEMVNDEFINMMKKGACLINTSRGEILNEAALIKGIQSGHIAGAALDAFQKEPPDPKNPLLSNDKVICTPHLGAQTDCSTNNMGEMAVKECLRVLAGESPEFQVN